MRNSWPGGSAIGEGWDAFLTRLQNKLVAYMKTQPWWLNEANWKECFVCGSIEMWLFEGDLGLPVRNSMCWNVSSYWNSSPCCKWRFLMKNWHHCWSSKANTHSFLQQLFSVHTLPGARDPWGGPGPISTQVTGLRLTWIHTWSTSSSHC